MICEDGRNKGLQAVGFERGHWVKDGRKVGETKAQVLEQMRDVLREDPDFKVCLALLQGEFADEDVAFAEGRCCFEMDYLSKFWCSLAFVEQYWNVAKQVTREECDYTITALKFVFPVALARPCHTSRCAAS